MVQMLQKYMPRIKSVLCQVCFIKYKEINIYYEKNYDVHKFMFLFLQVNILIFSQISKSNSLYVQCDWLIV